MIGVGKNGPPGKYERWLSSASSGSVGLAMITDRVQVQAWKVSEASVCLAFSDIQVFRCMSRRTRGVRLGSDYSEDRSQISAASITIIYIQQGTATFQQEAVLDAAG
ncbi:hypothetical protein PIB30_054348 [Stylosanthes scabra]|uniref:Uncharacterized protein n=1 Tax=Stylosanthes scabra TaxID=79078 RepID=A0ABU6YJ88_9FABA|nr:hypothetical protein [Stylosanthes scabra]